MLEYNAIIYKTNDSCGMCPIDRWEKSKRETQIQLFCLIDFTKEEVDELEDLYGIDKEAFAALIQEYIDIMPKFVCN